MSRFQDLNIRGLLETLAKELAPECLQQIFPGERPTRVRTLLMEAASHFPEQQTKVQALPLFAGQANKPAQESIDTLLLFSDGASRGNPGLAGAGYSICRQNGDEIDSGTHFLGTCTNNEAEYHALLHGLRKAKTFQPSSLIISLDSELIVRQIQGRYKVKNERLKLLYAEVKNLLDSFAQYQIKHVPRAMNARADELANQAIDQRSEN